MLTSLGTSFLDRQAEARTAIGTVPFSPEILNHFISVLSPYRKRILSMVKARFVLSAASLASKTPLPHDSLHAAPENWVGTVTHDALVLSQTFAATPEGKKSIQSGEFTRYWYVRNFLASYFILNNLISGEKQVLYADNLFVERAAGHNRRFLPYSVWRNRR